MANEPMSQQLWKIFDRHKLYLEDSVDPCRLDAGQRVNKLIFTVYNRRLFTSSRVGIVLNAHHASCFSGPNEDIFAFSRSDFDMQYLGETRPLRCTLRNIAIEGRGETSLLFFVYRHKREGDLRLVYDLHEELCRHCGTRR